MELESPRCKTLPPVATGPPHSSEFSQPTHKCALYSIFNALLSWRNKGFLPLEALAIVIIPLLHYLANANVPLLGLELSPDALEVFVSYTFYMMIVDVINSLVEIPHASVLRNARLIKVETTSSLCMRILNSRGLEASNQLSAFLP
ncbi:hypothetical protein L1987_07045 [Smallanthus sonchifolius]|uniref:Uncharacterized protein n=1 Tax=Smallanthus sonchifolius TaxID=185202 RepID=A0ACB9JZR6_9ASTR|nr:hypothetical protein L1987_07045 [Smallanthus sonchifolius]